MTTTKISTERSAIRVHLATRPGSGITRCWTRTLAGKRYSFTAVIMPDGERRYTVDRFDGPDGGNWTRLHLVRIPLPCADYGRALCPLCGKFRDWFTAPRVCDIPLCESCATAVQRNVMTSPHNPAEHPAAVVGVGMAATQTDTAMINTRRAESGRMDARTEITALAAEHHWTVDANTDAFAAMWRRGDQYLRVRFATNGRIVWAVSNERVYGRRGLRAIVTEYLTTAVVPTCEAHARKGTGTGVCGRPLSQGQCDRASDHIGGVQ